MTNREIFEAMGVDYEVTMPRFVDSEEFYLEMLKKFPEDENHDRLNGFLEEGNYEEAFGAAHTLKGVSGNMGFEILNQYIVPLTDELRNPPYDQEKIHDLWEKTNDAYQTCIDLIGKLGG